MKRSKKDVARVNVMHESPSVLEKQLTSLKQIFPEAFMEGKVDIERLRSILGNGIDTGPERFNFTWAGRRNAIQILQMPTRATLVPNKAESVDFEKTGNLFIEGDNLETMKLLYKSYFHGEVTVQRSVGFAGMRKRSKQSWTRFGSPLK